MFVHHLLALLDVCPVSAEEFETTLVNNNLQRSSFSLSLYLSISLSPIPTLLIRVLLFSVSPHYHSLKDVRNSIHVNS